MTDPSEKDLDLEDDDRQENSEDDGQPDKWCNNWVILQSIFAHLNHTSLGKVAQVNKVWNREVELRRSVYGVHFEFEIRGGGKGAITNSTRFFNVLEKCDCVRILRLDRLRFSWPSGLVGAERMVTMERLLPRGLPHLVRLCISRCALPQGFDYLLQAISAVAPNLEDVNTESPRVSLAEARALVNVIRAPGLRRLSVGEFDDVDDDDVEILRNLTTALAEAELGSRSTETTSTTTKTLAGSAESGVDAVDGDVESEGE